MEKTDLIKVLELLLEQGKKDPNMKIGDLLWRCGVLEYYYPEGDSFAREIVDPSIFTNEETLLKVKLKVKQLK